MRLKLAEATKHRIAEPIAIVGMGCYYPGADCLSHLWENILSKRCQFRQLPDQRLPITDYYHSDASIPDKTYGKQAAVLDGFAFDWVKRRVPQTVVDSTDIVHWLALEVAIAALEDAGYSRENVPTEQTGVILGNTLTGEQTRATTMRLRWPYVKRTLQASAQVRGLSEQVTDTLLETMEQFYKSVFAPITEDSLVGGLSNTIAGRICNFFNLDGGGYTVDGACSSSLIAILTAANSLSNGDLDLALAGGVDISLDTFELIGFAKTGALTASEMKVYDRRASGFIPGEGCGFVVLKRLADARRDHNYVYAVLNGWGVSSDGKGGLTAPSKIGQAKALRRAYEKAGYSPHTLHFIEGHGTGTPIGDRTELEGIALAMSANGKAKLRSCGVTSFKSLVGHTKAAAGVGGLIKAVMAVNQRIVPPTVNCQEPNTVFEQAAQCLYPVLQGEIYPPTAILRAGVSAMGFGGINSHVTLSSGDAPALHLKPSLNEQALLVSSQDSELFVLNAPSVTALLEKTYLMIEQAQGISVAELVDLAAYWTESVPEKKAVKAAILAGTPDELTSQLQQLEQMLKNSPPAPGEVKMSPQKTVWVSNQVQKTRVAFLFPGQGSQRLNMARTLIERYEWARGFLQEADNWLVEAGFEPIRSIIYRPLERSINQQQTDQWFQALTHVAPQAICFISLLWQRYLKYLGIKPIAVGGHSLGELTAFAAAGAYDEKTLLCFAALRGQVMSQATPQQGMMASLACSPEKAAALLQGITGYVVIANLNSPEQTVISGEVASVQAVIGKATAQEIQTCPLAVANAFHSQMMQPAAEYIRTNAPISEKLGQTEVLLFSSINGNLIQEGLSLKEHFAHQTIAQVNFIALVQNLAHECDLMLEVGPAKVLSGLVQNITNSPLCLPLESKPGSTKDFNTALACYFVYGGEINWKAVYENRLIRPFIPAHQRLFIDNPCERPLRINPEIAAKMTDLNRLAQKAPNNTIFQNITIQTTPSPALTQLLLELVEERTGFPRNTLTLNLRLLDDLNLDSIKAADLVATIAQKIGVIGKLDPSILANATLAEILVAIQEIQPKVKKKITNLNKLIKSNSVSWVRNFVIEYVPQKPIFVKCRDWSQAQVLLVCEATEKPLAQAIAQQLLQLGAMVQICNYTERAKNPPTYHFSDYIAILPQIASKEAFLPLSAMVSRLQSLTKNTRASANLAYVQFGGGYFGSGTSIEHPEGFCAAGFARSVHLERPQSKIRVIDLAQNIPLDAAAPLIISELENPDNILTVGYDAQQIRLIPQARLQQPIDYLPRNLTWSAKDVILVTGGAKGITAECAIALAQKTGVKMALVGRSSATGEVTQTLNRFQDLGLTCLYYACDMAHPEAVQDLAQKVTHELGQITGVIHGAGLNQPRRVEQVSFEAALTEVSPKLLGAYNLLETLSLHPPKLFLAFSSIIGLTGMPGNTWYAFANESLSLLLGHYQKQHPDTQMLSLAYSVWDKIGMGAKLGSVNHLERMGISAINPQEGVNRFLKLFECDPGVSQVIITGRLGGLDTWPSIPTPPPSGLRFIEQVLYFEPHVELIARTHLTLERDRYLEDHLWRGSYLFPTVFGLEAMAQSVAYLTGQQQPSIVRIEDISLKRPIVVDPTTGVTIEIQAILLEVDASGEQQVKIGIRTEQTGFSSDHFWATLILGKLPPGKNISPKIGKVLTIDPKTDLYGDLLFQGKRFQRIETIFSLDEKHSIFRSRVNLSVPELLAESFASTGESYLLLGDPYFRDVLLQSVQLTIPQEICLPVAIGHLEFFAPPVSDSGVRTVTVSLLEREGQEYISEVMATDAQGNLLERLTGYRLRILEEHPEHPTARELANPVRVVPQEERSQATTTPEKHRSRYTHDGPQGQLVYEQRFQVSFKESGSISRHIYFSQYFRWIGKIRELPMESIASGILKDFFSGDWGMVTNAVSLRVLGEATAYDIIQARAWVGNVAGSSFDTYIEFCKVLPNHSLERLAIAEVKATWVQLVSYGVPTPMPFPDYLQSYLDRFAAKIPAHLDLKRPEILPLPPLPTSLFPLNLGSLLKQTPLSENRYGRLLQSEVFQTTLEESNLVGNVYYGNYFIWQGRILDLFLYSVAPDYLRISNPQGEMVCLYSRMDYLREAMPFDRIETRLYVQAVSERGAVFRFEFFRKLADGSSEKLHVGQQEVAWVIRDEAGKAIAAPWPTEVLQALC